MMLVSLSYWRAMHIQNQAVPYFQVSSGRRPQSASVLLTVAYAVYVFR